MDPEPIRVTISGQITPVLLKRRGPPVTEENIVAFEKRFGYPLPKDYREFLLTYNGGRPVEGEVMGRDDQPDVPYEHGDAIECFFQLQPTEGAVSEFEVLLPPAEIPWDLEEVNFPLHYLPIAEGGGGNLIVMECKGAKNLVRYWQQDDYDERIEEHRVIADSFLDLLSRVRTVEERKALDAAEAASERKAIQSGKFPKALELQCERVKSDAPEICQWIRRLSEKIFDEKGHLSVHGDEQSRQLLDIAFYLYQSSLWFHRQVRKNELEKMFMGWWREGDGGFGFTGHCREFLTDWWDDRLAKGMLKGDQTSARMTPEAWQETTRNLIKI